MKKIIKVLIIIALLTGGFFVCQRVDEQLRQSAYKQAEEALTLTFKQADQLVKEGMIYKSRIEDEVLTYEYGKGHINLQNLVAEHTGSQLTVEPGILDLGKTGETQVVYTLESTDRYGETISKTFNYLVAVRDSVDPLILTTTPWVKLNANGENDLTQYVIYAADEVDGMLEYSETPKNNAWFIDTSEALEGVNGDFLYTIIARDKNGNEGYTGLLVTYVGGRNISEDEKTRLLLEKQQDKIPVADQEKLDEMIAEVNEYGYEWKEKAQKEEEARQQAQQQTQQQAGGSSSSQSSSASAEAQESGEPRTDQNYVNQVIALINEERSAQGLGSVSAASELNAAAQARANELASYFSHTRPDGSSCFTVLDEYGVSYGGAAENIAGGQSSPSQVMNNWMNSEGHRANILTPEFNHVGVGYVYIPGSQYGHYWVELFTD